MSSNNCGCNHNGTNGTNGSAQQKDYSKMQALTAIVNPQTVGKEHKVLLFQSLANGTVGYEHTPFNSRKPRQQGYGEGVVGNYDTKPVLSPVIRFGSNIVSMVVDDIVHVYGVSAHTNSLCLLSPVYQPLQDSEIDTKLQGKIAGCTNGQGESWLYFQKSGTNSRTGYIYQKSLASVNETPVRLPVTANAKLDTDIVSFHDGSRRWIAYQTYDEGEDEDSNGTSSIQLICIDNKSYNHVIAESENDVGDGMIELSATSAVKGAKNLVYIYFRGKESKIYWSAAELTGQGILFGAPKPIAQATKLDQRSSLDVIQDDKGIVIYGIKEKGKGIEAFHDPFVFA